MNLPIAGTKLAAAQAAASFFLWQVLLLMGLMPALSMAATPPGTVVSNTALAGYQFEGVDLVKTSNIVSFITEGLDATLAIQVIPEGGVAPPPGTPALVPAGTEPSTPVSFSNDESGPLTNAVVTVTPPPGTALELDSVAGEYDVVVLANGDLQISYLIPIPTASSITLPVTLLVPAGTTPGDYSVDATLVSNDAAVDLQASAPLTIEQGPERTPATIVFKKTDAQGDLIVAPVYHAGETVYLEVTDIDQDGDPLVAETLVVTLVDSISGDTEILTLTETGPNTGVFISSLPSELNQNSVSDNGIISVSEDTVLEATYVDRFDQTDTAESTALVDPFGIVFDSSTGTPIDGATVTLVDVATGQPAVVFGNDGVSPFPSSMLSGSTLVSAGVTYINPPGGFRFPLVPAGNYRLDVIPPVTHSFPSIVPTAEIQALPGAPFAIVPGSRNETFTVGAGPQIAIDIPLDPGQTALFISKVANKQTAAIGAVVPYGLRVENPDPVNSVNDVVVRDTLPPGFRYVSGSTSVNGARAADPEIGGNGRDLSFSIGTLAAAGVIDISYVTRIGVNARVGRATNQVSAEGIDVTGARYLSNIATAAVLVKDDLFGAKAFLVGRVFLDDNDNALHDENEDALVGVRVFMEDGRFAITDEYGDYHFTDVGLQTHVVQVDSTTIPSAYELVALPNDRFADRPFSQFVDMRKAGLWRANFRVMRKPPIETRVQVQQRIHSSMELTLHFNFPTIKADLTPHDIERLQRFIEDVRHFDITSIEVIGHTDAVLISPAHRHLFADNQQLSEARARVVADYLRRHLAIEISSRGVGASRPVADNHSERGKAENRRTVVHLIGRSSDHGDVVGSAPAASQKLRREVLPERDICLQVTHSGKLALQDLNLNYVLPGGWRYLPASAELDGKAVEPGTSMMGMRWPLDPALLEQTLCLRAMPGGDSGTKNSIAYADFAAQTQADIRNRTGMSVVKVMDQAVVLVESDLNMYFNFAVLEASLGDQDRARLARLVDRLAGMGVQSIEVTGHTDSSPITGASTRVFADNQALSVARAKVVADYLSALVDVPVHAVGLGGREPLTSNSTAPGRARNRRTAIKILSTRANKDWQSTVDELTNGAMADGGLSIAQGSESRILAAPAEVPELNRFDMAQSVRQAVPEAAWQWPLASDAPAIPSTTIAIQHAAGHQVVLYLDGGKVSGLNFNGTEKNPATGGAISTWIGVDLKEGDNLFEAALTDQAGKEITRVKQTVHYASPPIDAKWLKQQGHPVADAGQATVIAVQLLDKEGQPAREGLIGKYSIDLPYLIQENREQISAKISGNAEHARKLDFRTAKGGIVYAPLMPTARSGKAVLRFDLANGESVVEAWLKPQLREWILVGFGEGVIGSNTLKGALQPIAEDDEKDGYYTDGRVAFYAKGTVKGEYLLTVAYDTARSRGQTGRSLHQTIDPNSYYTIYGDATEQQFDAASQSKLYVKLERDTFYAMFGDYDTGLSVTELSRYSRSLNGFKSEYQGDNLGYNVFAAQTSQALVKDEIQGDGTSGLYRLSRDNIVINSESIRIETRQRFRSERLLTTQRLSRHVDYNIDYDDGTIFFKQPVASQDTALNPIWIVAEYESDDDSRDRLTSFGGRASLRSENGGLEVGATYIQQGRLGADDKLMGTDLKMRLSGSLTLAAEAAQTDSALVHDKRAYKLELEHSSARVQARAYARQQDDAFGLGQARDSENATRKYGADAQVRVTDGLSLQGEAYREQQTLSNARRDVGSARANYTMERGSVGFGVRQARDNDGAGNDTESRQALADARMRITDKLSAHVSREQNIGSQTNSVDFPTRTGLRLDYQLTDKTTLSAAQEWSQGDLQSTRSTRLGVQTQIWDGARLSTRYEQQLAEGGSRAFANVGLQQNFKLNELWSLDLGVDHSRTLEHSGFPEETEVNEDFTAFSVGTNYRPEDWVWNNRFEYRTATNSDKWSIATSLEGNLKPGLDSSLNLSWFSDRRRAGDDTDQGSIALNLAWRPAYDDWIYFDKLEVVYGSTSGLGPRVRDWRYINNLHANWQINEQTQMANYLGVKWTRTHIGDRGYNGFLGMASTRLTYDINPDWDIEGSASGLWSDGQIRPGYGVALGHNLIDNVWVSLGYNFTGFYDEDFAGAEYARQGWLLRFSYKFDQRSWTGRREDEP